MIKVRAVARGFYGKLREEDDVFNVKEGDAQSSWYIPMSDLKKVSQPEIVDRPTTEAEAKRLTNDQLKAFLDEDGVEYADGDTKKDLIIKLFAQNEGGDEEGDESLV